MRLGTYNVQGFRGFGEGPGRPDLSQGPVWVEALARLACDVLALQEAGDDPGRVREIARGLGMEALWLASPGRWPGAILWGHRFRCVEGGVLRTEPAGEDGPFSRSAGFVRLEAADRGADGEPDVRLDRDTLEILSIHAHPSDAEMRMQEALFVEEWWEGFRSIERIERIERDGERPAAVSTAVMGDFNSESGAPLHRTLARLGLQSVFEPGRAPRTHLKDRDRVAVDHIHLSRGLRGALRGAGVVREAGFQPDTPGGWAFSDHLPVVADLAWSPASGRSARLSSAESATGREPRPVARARPHTARGPSGRPDPPDGPIGRCAAALPHPVNPCRGGTDSCVTSSRPDFAPGSRRPTSRSSTRVTCTSDTPARATAEAIFGP